MSGYAGAMLNVCGIHYDVGTTTLEGGTTRPLLPVDTIERELDDIAIGLHANAVRVTGGDVERIATAARLAAGKGLEAWLTPMLPNADAATTLRAVEAAARAGQDLLDGGHRCTLIVGCELSVFMHGILPGATHGERMGLLVDPARLMVAIGASGLDPQAQFAAFLRSAAATARAHFSGPVAYAAGLWEDVDWSLFDIVGLDAYRDADNRATYAATLAKHLGAGRRVVVTETGCATYRGAAAAGGMAWTAVERRDEPRRLRPGVVRDEREQAEELGELLDLAEQGGVDGVFIYTYVAPSYPSSANPEADLDAASYALVRSWPDGRTEPKLAYGSTSERYRAASARALHSRSR
jgi:hypothetical protein